MTKATVKGRGPELFGRGIDLLFGDEESSVERVPASGRSQSSKESTRSLTDRERPDFLQEMPPLPGPMTNGFADIPAVTENDVDQFLRMAAEAFLRVQEQRRHHSLAVQPASRSGVTVALAPSLAASEPVDDLSGIDLAVPPVPDDTAEPVELPVAHADTATESPVMEIDLDVPPIPVVEPASEPENEAQPALVPEENSVQPPSVTKEPAAPAKEDVMPDEPPQPESATQPIVSENGQTKAVAPPGVPVSGPGGKEKLEEIELSSSLIDREAPAMSRKEVEEILARLPKSDLRALDKQIDQLYDDVTKLFSGNRREITVAFDVLRKARIILLKDPEQFPEAEYLVRQVQARVHQVRQSNEQGSHFWPRILVYQTVWLAVLSVIALITTVNGAAFVNWLAFLLGVPATSETLGWAVLFLSTLAWGGIGGATSGMWSLYYHISIQRDYEPIENLWYYTQPLIGMVLGGIVFLIMGSGFLIVQATPTAGESAIGARLVPAVIAVVAGFRQTVVLDMIERIVGLITPSKNGNTTEMSTEESTI